MAVKAAGSSLPPAKRRRTDKAASKPTHSVASVTKLEKKLTEALSRGASLNELLDLLRVVSDEGDAEVVSKAIYALFRVLAQVQHKGLLDPRAASADSERRVLRTWLMGIVNDYAELLFQLLKDEEAHLRTSALQVLFSLLRLLSTSQHAGEDSPSTLPFDVPFFRRIVQALLICPSSFRESSRDEEEDEETDGLLETDVRDLLVSMWLNKYADVRWYFLRETPTFLSTESLISAQPHIPSNALSILEKLDSMPQSQADITTFWIEGLNASTPSRRSVTSSSGKGKNTSAADEDEDEEDEASPDDWRAFFDEPAPDKSGETRTPSRRLHTMTIREQLSSYAAHRAVFTRCWLTLLPLLSTPSSAADARAGRDGALLLTTRALSVLHRGVMPFLTRPVLIMDWVAGCVDVAGTVGLLALNALFMLMQEYNLDYPQFYTRLYAFLDRDVLHVKHRARFFRLTELFLSSSHLPATLLASFIKRLSRLSLSAPPAAIIMLIPFTYNILKRHPALMAMIHNRGDSDNSEDPYDPSEPDPTKTNAIQSSLWELYSHRRHYHSAVSTLTKVFEEAFTKPNYNMEDFLDHTYATLFETEVKRRMKVDVPVMEAELRRPMLPPPSKTDAAKSDAVPTGDVVSSLWTFS